MMPETRRRRAIQRPNLRFDHAFVILRLDEAPLDVNTSDDISVQKIVWSQEIAESEVARLTALNRDKHCQYFWKIARIERR